MRLSFMKEFDFFPEELPGLDLFWDP